MKNILLTILTISCLSVYAQDKVTRFTVVPSFITIKKDSRTNPPEPTDTLDLPFATSTKPGVMTPLQVGELSTATATNITQGETIKAQGKALDSIKTVLSTTPPIASQLGYGEVTTSTYTVTSADAGKHILFRVACTITVTGLQPGQRVSLSSIKNRLPVSGSGMHSKSSFKTIQAGGCATVVGENGGFSLSGDLSN